MPASAQALTITVRLMEGRYHGNPEWPPSPARLFQALVAASAGGGRIDPEPTAALRWLERQPAPTIVAPNVSMGRALKQYVPNNDLDAKGGIPSAVAGIRTAKITQPRIFDATTPFIYAWPLSTDSAAEQATQICSLSLGLYQLGRGVDMAYASGELIPGSELSALLHDHPGQVYVPAGGSTRKAHVLLCPESGSLDSLTTRYEATLRRFRFEGEGKDRVQVFQQPPKPHFAKVAYDSPPRRALFDLRPPGEMAVFARTHLSRIVRLTEAVRDAAANRLVGAFPARGHDVERAMVGRRVDDLARLPEDARVRICALPSIGHVHVDRGIRRLLVEVPTAGPLRADDVFWAFSGLTIRNLEGTELVVTRADDEGMLKHYGLDEGHGHRLWRTITPTALPPAAARRRIEPTRQAAEAKGSTERAREENQAALSVTQALRHAGIRAPVEHVRVQREPFEKRGARAETFAPGTRFAKERLWHVEIGFREPVCGPLAIGDGRFLGLGLMAPAGNEDRVPGILAFQVASGLQDGASPSLMATALRRATMARFQNMGATEDLPAFVSGHDDGGRPAGEGAPHLSYVFDQEADRLLVVAPHIRDHRRATGEERRHLRTLEQAMAGFTYLTAGSAGRLLLFATDVAPSDSLLAPSRCWVSRTPYVVNRHRKRGDVCEAIEADIRASCRQIGLPTPRVVVLETRGVPGVGLTGRVELNFEVAVRGPLLLGRTRHKGGGLFVPGVVI